MGEQEQGEQARVLRVRGREPVDPPGEVQRRRGEQRIRAAHPLGEGVVLGVDGRDGMAHRVQTGGEVRGGRRLEPGP
ncbi:hypothetical protein GCM10009592_15050 [Brachybacterium rhamnosum]